MKLRSLILLCGCPLLASCESIYGEREDSRRAEIGSYEDEIAVAGIVVDAEAWLLRGEVQGRSGGNGGTLALSSPDGLFLLLPPGPSTSDSTQADFDARGEEQLAMSLRSLQAGDRVRVRGELYRREGLQGIEVEWLRRDGQ